MQLSLTIFSETANSVDPDKTAPSNLIWVCTVCICHFVRNFRTFAIYNTTWDEMIQSLYKSFACVQGKNYVSLSTVYIQTKMHTLYGKMTINGHLSLYTLYTCLDSTVLGSIFKLC